jgi:hypothetical protein
MSVGEFERLGENLLDRHRGNAGGAAGFCRFKMAIPITVKAGHRVMENAWRRITNQARLPIGNESAIKPATSDANRWRVNQSGDMDGGRLIRYDQRRLGDDLNQLGQARPSGQIGQGQPTAFDNLLREMAIGGTTANDPCQSGLTLKMSGDFSEPSRGPAATTKIGAGHQDKISLWQDGNAFHPQR